MTNILGSKDIKIRKSDFVEKKSIPFIVNMQIIIKEL